MGVPSKLYSSLSLIMEGPNVIFTGCLFQMQNLFR